MITTHEPTLGEMVTERPELGRVFERYGIDYCCGGRHSLEDECRRHNLSLAEVRAAIDAAQRDAGEVDPAALAPAALCEHIVGTHHAFLRRELPRLAALLQRVVAAHGGRHPELHELLEVYRPFADEMEFHMLKEEKMLFPAIRRLDQFYNGLTPLFARVSEPIRVMESEHDDAGRALARMRDLTSGFVVPPDGCPTYRVLLAGLAELEADLHEHVHKENNILFPRALRLEQELLTSA